jgi:hypothetical protein
MEGMMFDTSEAKIHTLKKGVLKQGVLKIGSLNVGIPGDTRCPDPDALKEHCLESASLWVLKRRANLPYLPVRRLPAVARGG